MSPTILFNALLAGMMLATLGNISQLLAIPWLLLPWMNVQRVVTPFDASMPVSGRDLRLARMLGSALHMIAAALFSLLCLPMWRSVNGDAREGLLHVLAFVPLMVLLPELLGPIRLGMPSKFREILLQCIALGLFMLLLWLWPATPVMLILAACTLIAGARVLSRLPTSIELVPLSVQRAPVQQSSARLHANSTGGELHWWRLVAREWFSWRVILMWSLYFLFGALGNALYAPTAIGIALAALVRARVRWMNSLPIGRHVRLFFLAVPIAVVPTLLVGIGQRTGVPGINTRLYMGSDAPRTPYSERYFSSETKVPLAFWRLAPERVAPRIESPSGESCIAYTLSFGPVILYNPYSSRESNSAQFVEWQFARATSAVYGRPITQAEFKTARRQSAVPLRVTDSLRLRLLCGSAFLSFLLFLLWVDHLVRTPLVSVRRKGVASGIMMAPVLVILGMEVAYVKAGIHAVGDLTELVMLSLSAWLPGNLAIVALVALVPVMAMYALLSWQFARSENTDRIVPTPI